MNELYLKSILTGVTFGLLPLFLKNTRLNGLSAATLYTALMMAILIPMGLMETIRTTYTARTGR